MTTLSQEQRLFDVLDRKAPCESLDALLLALQQPRVRGAICLADTAIGWDTNALLRIGNHSESDGIIDYLISSHKAPIVLPGQAIQEFWNHQEVIETVSSSLRKKFDDFKKDLDKVGFGDSDCVAKMKDLLSEFDNEYGHIFDEKTARKTILFLENIRDKAIVSYSSRILLQPVANNRKQTKTPPGFKDSGDGDFYIWADFLTGLMQAQKEEKQFSRVVMISRDVKKDWVRAKTAHPILVAEVKALLGLPFELWTLDDLAKEVNGTVGGR